MTRKCEYLEGRLCEAFARGAAAFSECEMPDTFRESCPIAVSQTGDRSFAQAVGEYRQIVAQAKAQVK